MTWEPDWARVTAETLEVSDHLDAVADPRCGAVVTFLGQIRDHDPGAEGEVTGIAYSAHPDATAALERIAREVVAGAVPHEDVRHEEVVRLAVSHRVGDLAVGDLALVACVATAHRALAQDLCRELVERIKVELPVWKKQHTADGASHWVGL
ncbi:molybdenum cofactor biosynthesis protein MoaE [Serinibacter salmoneus]|uniref:Molybdopterin synthase catalytic subunit n=1 Tax=Serinibacter salmoneus TaxID=556530 RepID=A0A2A9D598_9MICO|nr:molybdenum cofactor biosynthesis protein MoaE [Serinibacter salmoneus]PFG21029.1 molybdopterin synthase catalytic subunit [Serinibacter salmoneus]